jgi:hypothetical protein
MKALFGSLNRFAVFTSTLAAAAATAFAADTQPYLGEWGFSLPGGETGWLGITKEAGYYDAGMLWGWGSVTPVDSLFFTDDGLYLIRINEVKRKDASGKVVRTHRIPEAIMARLEGDELVLTQFTPRASGEGLDSKQFTAKRLPPMPPAPILAQVKFGAPITLFNGKDLTGWRLTAPGDVNGWSVQDGLLVNRPVQEEGKPHKNYGNLRTDREFEDFNLTLEFRLPKGGNSGVYLRGIYEVQVADTFGKPLDPHNCGGLYSRIKPSESAEKPAGEWQTYDITLVDRHVTVVLNGKQIIANQPVPGPTGGALWPEVNRPGPLYLQGDHTGVDYRNLVIKPVVK